MTLAQLKHNAEELYVSSADFSIDEKMAIKVKDLLDAGHDVDGIYQALFDGLKDAENDDERADMLDAIAELFG